VLHRCFIFFYPVASNFEWSFWGLFSANKRLAEGTAISPILFNFYFEFVRFVLDETVLKDYCTLYGIHLRYLFFADDLMLISKNKADSQKLINAAKVFCSEWNLVINEKKCELMILGKRRGPSYVVINGQPIHAKDSVRYLGVQFQCWKTWEAHRVNVISKLIRVSPKASTVAKFLARKN